MNLFENLQIYNESNHKSVNHIAKMYANVCKDCDLSNLNDYIKNNTTDALNDIQAICVNSQGKEKEKCEEVIRQLKIYILNKNANENKEEFSIELPIEDANEFLNYLKYWEMDIVDVGTTEESTKVIIMNLNNKELEKANSFIEKNA